MADVWCAAVSGVLPQCCRPLLQRRTSVPPGWCPGSAAPPGSHWTLDARLANRGNLLHFFRRERSITALARPTHFLRHTLEEEAAWAPVQVRMGSEHSPSPPRCPWCLLTRPSLRGRPVYSPSHPNGTDAQHTGKQHKTFQHPNMSLDPRYAAVMETPVCWQYLGENNDPHQE